METIPSEMLRGHVDTIILLSLLDCDKHTSQIKEEIESRVDGQFELKQGTFYSCLQRIVGQGFVTEYRSTSADGKRRKFYQLTEKGKAYIEENKDKWLFSRGVIDTLIQVPEDTTQIDSVYSYDPKKKTQSEIIEKQATVIEKQATELDLLNNKIEVIQSKIDQISAETAEIKSNSLKENDDSKLNDSVTQIEFITNEVEQSPLEEPAETESQTVNSSISDNDLTELEKFLYESYETPQKTEYDSEPEKDIHEVYSEPPVSNQALENTAVEDNNAQVESKENENSFDSMFTFVKPENINSQVEKQDKEPEASQNEKVISFDEIKQEKSQPDIFDFIENNSAENSSETKSIEIPGIFEKVTDNYYNYQADYQAPQQTTLQEPQYDDYYDGEAAITHDYKDVLTKLFPAQKTAPQQVYVEQPVYEQPVYEPQPAVVAPEPEYQYAPPADPEPQVENVEEEYAEPQIIRSEPKKPSAKSFKEIRKSKVKREEIQSDERSDNSQYDFSDIYALAESEGYKVKTASAHSNKDIGKILINKLLMSSSLTFFIILTIEALILGFTTKNVAKLTWTPYLVFIGISALFPLTCILMYFIDPRRKVDSLVSFKSIMSFIFIVVLNLIIIIFVYAILINIDFTNIRRLMIYILYPLIVSLNLPIYFFIKYLKLDEQKYYS